MATTLASGGTAPSGAASARAPQCPSTAFTLRANDDQGAFAGTSHGGAELDLRNVSDSTCTAPTLPAVTFAGASGGVLPISADDGAGARDTTIDVEPGVVAVASVRYVSSDVFTNGRCFAARRLGLEVARHAALVWTRFEARTCGSRRGASIARKPSRRDGPAPTRVRPTTRRLSHRGTCGIDACVHDPDDRYAAARRRSQFTLHDPRFWRRRRSAKQRLYRWSHFGNFDDALDAATARRCLLAVHASVRVPRRPARRHADRCVRIRRKRYCDWALSARSLREPILHDPRGG
ncbi:MAG: DUF4232 domain-containing protein [Candidatus Eremiobacteraeota bacterium]|nr:DUF4232 domain-containing protein [Candidatus Eremiobacteraeota bacterium]MBC5801713.1 DUF4232 domain-containing protein [Candidatus Eremiobacteraeota bacterium]MBC5822133.1 DUF4232 domain-containing protein [Candidatus Eremiobacteraeota bacterium]